MRNIFTCIVISKQVKQEVSRTAILSPPIVTVICFIICSRVFPVTKSSEGKKFKSGKIWLTQIELTEHAQSSFENHTRKNHHGFAISPGAVFACLLQTPPTCCISPWPCYRIFERLPSTIVASIKLLNSEEQVNFLKSCWSPILKC